MVPMTLGGKILASLISLIGIGFIALPSGILVYGFIETMRRDAPSHPASIACPHCGNEIHFHKGPKEDA